MQFPDFHPVLHAIEAHIVKSLPEYSIIFGLFLVAVIANMVKPVDVRNLLLEDKSMWTKFKESLVLGYEWFYNSMQAFMAARHPQSPMNTTTTQVTTPTSSVEQRIETSASPTPAVSEPLKESE